jgi:hypothetical protein
MRTIPVCNFEAPIEGFGAPIPKSGPHLNQRRETIAGLRQQGFDLLLLANNHMMDYGVGGLKATLDEIEQNGLDHAGAGMNFSEAYKPFIKEINGYRFGIVNACEAQFGVLDYSSHSEDAGYAWINHSLIDKTILNLKKSCDFVIVFPHAGLENYSVPQREWRYRYRHLCDLGADVVIGSHPHVPQGYEEYESSLIFYSLGNFYFDRLYHADEKEPSYSVILEFGGRGRLAFEPVFHHKQNGQVVLSSDEQRIDIAKLNSQLSEGYVRLLEEMSVAAYDNDIKRWLLLSLSAVPYYGHWAESFRTIVSTLLGRRDNLNKNLLHLHLLRYESYYYAAKQALEVKSRSRDKGFE